MSSLAIKEFFEQFRLIEGEEVSANCMFSLAFLNEKKNVRIKAFLSGKETLEKCAAFADAMRRSLNDGCEINIEVLPPKDLALSVSQVSDLFESGIKFVNDPEKYSGIDNLLPFARLYSR